MILSKLRNRITTPITVKLPFKPLYITRSFSKKTSHPIQFQNYKHGVPEIKVSVPPWLIFGLLGFAMSRHRVDYEVEQVGPTGGQTIAVAERGFEPNPHIWKVIGYTTTLAIAAEVAWISGLRASKNPWGYVQLMLTAPVWRGSALGFRIMFLCYCHIMACSLLHVLYIEYTDPPKRTMSPNRSPFIHLFFLMSTDVWNTWMAFFSQTFVFALPGCVGAGLLFAGINRWHFRRQLATMCQPMGKKGYMMGKAQSASFT